MENYSIEDFRTDVYTNREFEFTFKDKMYALTYEKEGFVFTDVREDVYCIYSSYEDLLGSVRIEGYSIEEIIVGGLCENLGIF